jgi:hypothetical protein
MTIRLDPPDTRFRLTDKQRASVRRGFDVAALERLLAHVVPEARAVTLGAFLPADDAESARNTIRMADPALQPLLDEVWAGFWEANPDLLAFKEDDAVWPGRALARQRLRTVAEDG